MDALTYEERLAVRRNEFRDALGGRDLPPAGRTGAVWTKKGVVYRVENHGKGPEWLVAYDPEGCYHRRVVRHDEGTVDCADCQTRLAMLGEWGRR